MKTVLYYNKLLNTEKRTTVELLLDNNSSIWMTQPNEKCHYLIKFVSRKFMLFYKCPFACNQRENKGDFLIGIFISCGLFTRHGTIPISALSNSLANVLWTNSFTTKIILTLSGIFRFLKRNYTEFKCLKIVILLVLSNLEYAFDNLTTLSSEIFLKESSVNVKARGRS